MAQIRFTFGPKFLGSLVDLPQFVHSKLVKCLNFFVRDRRHPGLNVETLEGKSRGLWSARVDREYRLIFAEPSENQILLLLVGKHDDVYGHAEEIEGVRLFQTRMISAEPSEVLRLVSPRARKYLPLAKHLAGKPADVHRVEMTFAEIILIIGNELPTSAYKYSAWWANDQHRHVQASASLGVGWKTADLRVKEGRIAFVRAL